MEKVSIGMFVLDAVHHGQPVEAMRKLLGLFADPSALADRLFLDGFRDIDEWARAANGINQGNGAEEELDAVGAVPTMNDMKIMVSAMRDNLHLFGKVCFSQSCKEQIVTCIDSANAILKKRNEDEDRKKEARRIEQESARSMAHRKTVAKYEKRRR